MSIGAGAARNHLAISTQMTVINLAMAAVTFCLARGYLSRGTASLPFGRQQIILLGDRGRCMCVCEQFAQSCHLAVKRPGVEPTNSRLRVYDALTTTTHKPRYKRAGQR